MENLSEINSSERMYSVRHPRNVWVVRFLAFSVLMITLDIPSSDSLNIKPKTDIWADNFIITNNLDYPSEIVPNQPAKPLIAFNSSSITENSNTEYPNTNTSTSKLVSDVSEVEPVQAKLESHSDLQSQIISSKKEELAHIYVEPHSATVFLNTDNELMEPQFTSFQQSDRIVFSQVSASKNFLLDQSMKMFVVSGAIGPIFNSGSINSPSGETYASASQIENLEAENLGSSNNSSSNGFAAMLNVGMKLGRNFEVHSGFNFVQLKGSHVAYYDSKVEKYQTIVTGVNTSNNDGSRNFQAVTTNVPYTNYFSDTIQSNYKLSSIEIPLIIKYNFGKQRLSYFVSSGVSTVLGSNYSSSFESNEIDNGKLNETKYGFNTFNILVNVGIQYQISPNMMLNFAPGYKYGIPLNNSSIIQSRTSAVGVFTGLSYYFK